MKSPLPLAALLLIVSLAPFSPSAAQAPGADSDAATAQGTEPAKPQGKNEKNGKEKPKVAPAEKHWANPDDDGGAQKAIPKSKLKRCAYGRLTQLDPGAQKLSVTSGGETVEIRFDKKTEVRLGERRGSLADLKVGRVVKVYCLRAEPEGAARLIEVKLPAS
ncbi:MAG TPA: hypothetical protein VMM92_12735 [Thermoanaerobaculia bacterium]|nr:hypothetical protein [Thermoanaerobaculia bacterium]